MLAATSPVPVVVYVLGGCPHCTRATSLLDVRGIGHTVVSGDGVAGFRAHLRELTGGATVPQVIIDGRPIGGADQLVRLDRCDVLQALVDRRPLPVTRVRRRRMRRAASRWSAEAFDASGRRVARVAGPDPASARNALAEALGDDPPGYPRSR